MDRYTIYCTKKQTKKALKLGAPLYKLSMSVDDSHLRDKSIRVNKENELVDYALSTAEQMIGFLRSKNIKFHFDDETNYWSISDANNDITPLRWYGYSNNKELDAIDAALDYLIKNKLEQVNAIG